MFALHWEGLLERSTILKPTGCDLTRLPLGALEAFVLSQLDGQLTLEEVAEVCSLELGEASKIASRLVELGAACKGQIQAPQRDKRGRKTRGVAVEEVARSGRRDPRSDDISLRPPPPKPSAPPMEKPPERRRSRESLRMQRASSRRMKVVKRTTPPPTRARTERPQASAKKTTTPPAPSPAPSRPSKRPSKSGAPVVAPARPPAEPSVDRMRKLQAAAREIEVQARVAPLLAAADEALKTNDVINAANNLRLALQHRDDPLVRLKLEEVDRLARAVRLERSLASARAAEEKKRWADAVVHLTRAHETKPTAEIADRAANALLRSQGDLQRAAKLAEQAVALDPKNARYRLTLAEVCLEAEDLTRAAKEAAVALQLSPKDPRARELADTVARVQKESIT